MQQVQLNFRSSLQYNAGYFVKKELCLSADSAGFPERTWRNPRIYLLLICQCRKFAIGMWPDIERRAAIGTNPGDPARVLSFL